MLPFMLAVWSGCAILLAFGLWIVPAAVVNFFLCHYFFVSMRWHGVLRGMGAPGFMTYWLAAAVLFIELAREFAPELIGFAVLVFQIDFAFIMISAGIYKLSAGYAHNYGMELGLANPQWGYWWRTYREIPPANWIFRAMNHLAWSTEIVSGVLMLIPQTRIAGAMLIVLSFVFIATQIRLAFLCEMVIVGAILFFVPVVGVHEAVATIRDAPNWPATALSVALIGYLALLPFAHAGLFYNFYRRRSLPQVLQRSLEIYTNFLGIIIWRVFSADHTNFCIFVYRQESSTERRVLLSDYGSLRAPRFAHVGESIAITSLFTTLKYYPSNNALFQQRLVRYARTLPCPAGSFLVFEYVSLLKGTDRFIFEPIVEFLVVPSTGAVTERPLSDAVSIRAPHVSSPVHEAARPGTYAPSVS
jgi:hypothetical protein